MHVQPPLMPAMQTLLVLGGHVCERSVCGAPGTRNSASSAAQRIAGKTSTPKTLHTKLQ